MAIIDIFMSNDSIIKIINLTSSTKVKTDAFIFQEILKIQVRK